MCAKNLWAESCEREGRGLPLVKNGKERFVQTMTHCSAFLRILPD